MTEEQIIRLYGERCAEYCPECCVCEVWAMHDLIETQAREIERLREALESGLQRASKSPPGFRIRILANAIRAALEGKQ